MIVIAITIMFWDCNVISKCSRILVYLFLALFNANNSYEKGLVQMPVFAEGDKKCQPLLSQHKIRFI